MPDLPTGTVTFLFTDIEGSTRLWEQQPGAMQSAVARHDALLREIIAAGGGAVFNTMGDAFCAAFDTAGDALTAALAAQRALQETPEISVPLRVRMAIHTGTAELRGGDYFGPALSRVHRLLSAAHGGQVLLSLPSEELVRDGLPPDVALRDLGQHRLRDLHRPEHIFQLVHPALPSEFPPLRSLDTLPNNLPRALTSFVGRETQIRDVRRLLSAACLLTLTGSGGCGKSRLAVQVAAELLEEYPDGVWQVELASLSDGALVPQAVASALGVREEPGRPLTETLVEYLRSRRLLLLLDNCEHLVGACARFAEHLLQLCGNLRVLVTSREPLAIGGEVTYRVPSLSLPGLVAAEPAGEGNLAAALTQYEAVQLFIQRAQAAQPGFAVTNANAPAVAQICFRLDGIPLAIELAAARVRALSVEQIAARLDDRFRLLTGGSRTALPRQQTLQAAVDWSYNLLSPGERTLLRRLAVFAGGWTLSAAESVCAGDGLDGLEEWEILDLLTGLVDKSLVVVDETAAAGDAESDETRYRLLETVRAYGRDRLDASKETQTLRRRHQETYLAFAETVPLQGAGQLAGLNRFEAEHGNLRAALAACDEDDPEASLRLTGALWRFWEMRSFLSEGREHLTRALARPGADTASPGARANAHLGLGRIAWCQGDYAPARDSYEEARRLFEGAGDRGGVAAAIHGLGNVAHFECDDEQARALFQQSLALHQEQRNARGVAGLLNILGVVNTDLGDYAAARAYFEECEPVARRINDPWILGILQWARGNLALVEGDFAQARRFFGRALTTATHLGAAWCVPYALEGFGCLAAAERQGTRAAHLLGAAESLRATLGTRLPPSERARQDPALSAARAALGDAGFDEAWTAGRALSREQAIAEAHGE